MLLTGLILNFYLEAYVVYLLGYVIIRLISGRKLPFYIMLFNCLILTAFYLTRIQLSNHQWIFFGHYQESDHWADGMANVTTAFYNLGFLFILFCITQLGFWIFFLRHYRKLNEIEHYKDVLDHSFNTGSTDENSAYHGYGL
jgi:hypothetical protein